MKQLRLRGYLVYMRLAVQDSMSFRLQFWGSMGEAVLSFFLGYYLWRAIYGTASELNGFRREQMVSYLLVSALVRGAFGGSPIAYIGGAYESASFGADLVRPQSLPLVCLARSAGVSAIYLLTRGLPIFTVGALAVGVEWPDAITAVQFALSLLLSFFVYFQLEFLFAQLIPYVQSYYGIHQVWGLLTVFATGALIPLPFFPEWLRQLLFALPFHTVYYTPINLFLGNAAQLSPTAAMLLQNGCSSGAAVLLEQVGWLFATVLLSSLTWQRARMRLILQGG